MTISLRDAPADKFLRKQVRVEQISDDQTFACYMTITTNDLSPQFVNCSNPQVDLSIVDKANFNANDNPTAILIPVTLTSLSVVDGRTNYYYTQRYTIKNILSPIVDMDVCVVKDGAPEELSDPYLLVLFKVGPEIQQTNSLPTAESGSFSGSSAYRAHVDKGENANGGITLPVGQVKSDQGEEQRELAGERPDPELKQP